MAKAIVVSPEDKNYILAGLEMAVASCNRLANRQGQLPFAVQGYRNEASKIMAVHARVTSWEVTNT